MFRIRSERAIGAHAHTWGNSLTVGEIIDRVHSERLHAAAQATRARQAAIAAAFDAPTLTLPVVVDAPTLVLPVIADVDIVDAEIVAIELDDPDQPKTRPMSRYELFLEVDGGRPLHDLDFVNRYAMGGAR